MNKLREQVDKLMPKMDAAMLCKRESREVILAELITFIRKDTLDEVEETVQSILPKLAEDRDKARIGRQGYMEGKITGTFKAIKAIDNLRDKP